jgi:hypothetical protein
MNKNKRLWWGLILLVLLSPLGLILPEVFRSGPAWGEWSLEEIEKMIGFIPRGPQEMDGPLVCPPPRLQPGEVGKERTVPFEPGVYSIRVLGSGGGGCGNPPSGKALG